MAKIIIIFGWLAFISLILTVLIGVMFFKLHIKWVKMKWHIWLGLLTATFAAIHVAAILYSYKM